MPKTKPGRVNQSPRTVGQLTSHIANKQVRSEKYAKLKHKKKKEQKAERNKRQREVAKAEELGMEPPPKKIPKTLENTRERDETVTDGVLDEEVAADEGQDEFAGYFSREAVPKVLLTTCYRPSRVMFRFIGDLMSVLPSAYFYKRQGYPLKKIVGYAAARGFTDVAVVNEDRKAINGLLLCHLPTGPTALFKLSNMVLARDIQGHGRARASPAELVLNNFDTRLGRRVGRMLASLFAPAPAFRGRQVATFHNQRDFIFFRHHRYVFEERGAKRAAAEVKSGVAGPNPGVGARLQELGPRFTLRLRSLQKGLFDAKGGEFEWLAVKGTTVAKGAPNASRRRFHM